VDVLLLMAASENDLPKVEELLAAGANTSVTDSNNKTPLELATKEEVVAALQAANK
jgi:ankyrin repeat protein